MTLQSPPSLLCVCNYPSNTGYAWDFIESLYAAVANRLAPLGVRTFVAYPAIDRPPATLVGSAAQPVLLDARLGDARSARDTIAFLRAEHVGAIYLTDRPAWSRHYAAVHLRSGARIVVHDHSSGARSRPAGLKVAAKWLAARTPFIQADAVIAVSEYVKRRQIDVGLVPPHRVVRIWNGIPVPPAAEALARPLHTALGLGPDRLVIACACRTAPEKGVDVLLEAFDLLWHRWRGDRKPVLVYMGDGPHFPEVQRLRSTLGSHADIVLTGYRRDAGELLGGADVCAMPSVWEDALPLAVMQPMAQGRAVVASAVGGIPEMIVDGESGVLVPPRDAAALARALERLLADRDAAARLGRAARQRVGEVFTPQVQIEALTAVLTKQLGIRSS